jgi:rod shape determining protein RodA
MPEQLPVRARDYLWPPAAALLALLCALAMPSVPTAVVAFGVSLAILSLVRWPWWTRILFVCGVGSLPLFLWQLIRPYQRARILAWLTPDRDLLGSGYAFHQSIEAIHAGGWLGSGEAWASARPLPSALSDMPFTLLAHQHGLLGGLLLLALLGLVIGVALRLAWTTRGPFFRALGVGVAAFWLGHALLSVGGGLGLLPLNGATLPLVSFGGSGTVAAMITLGLLAHVALRSPELKANSSEETVTPSVF